MRVGTGEHPAYHTLESEIALLLLTAKSVNILVDDVLVIWCEITERFSGFMAGERWARKAAKSICEDREGATWIATGDGLYRFNSGNITAYNISPEGGEAKATEARLTRVKK